MAKLFTHRLRVRYSECDQQGVVFNGHYLFYYDVAVTELWREALGGYTSTINDGAELVVAEARIRYRESARFDELLDIDMPITCLGTTSMVVRPVFRIGGRRIADGEVRHVFTNPANHTKREIPDKIRTVFGPYTTPAE